MTEFNEKNSKIEEKTPVSDNWVMRKNIGKVLNFLYLAQKPVKIISYIGVKKIFNKIINNFVMIQKINLLIFLG